MVNNQSNLCYTLWETSEGSLFSCLEMGNGGEGRKGKGKGHSHQIEVYYQKVKLKLIGLAKDYFTFSRVKSFSDTVLK